MFLNIYDKNIKCIGIIQTWISMTWEEQYNDVGAFTLEVVQTDEMVKLLKPWRYCTIDKSDSVMVILSVSIADGHIVAYGKSAISILDRRISTQTISNVNAEQALLSLVNSMSEWDGLVTGELSGISDVFASQKSGGSVLDYFKAIAESVDMGFKVLKKGYRGILYDSDGEQLLTANGDVLSIFDISDTFCIVCYKPAENKNARYSLSYGNLTDVAYTISDVEHYNVALVCGAGEGDDRVKVYAGDTDATGTERLELYVDARDLQQEQDETLEHYKARLVARGEEKLLEAASIDNVTFNVDEEKATLGDIVSVMIPEYGVTKKVRVTSRTITSEYNAERITLGVGESIL